MGRKIRKFKNQKQEKKTSLFLSSTTLRSILLSAHSIEFFYTNFLFEKKRSYLILFNDYYDVIVVVANIFIESMMLDFCFERIQTIAEKKFETKNKHQNLRCKRRDFVFIRIWKGLEIFQLSNLIIHVCFFFFFRFDSDFRYLFIILLCNFIKLLEKKVHWRYIVSKSIRIGGNIVKFVNTQLSSNDSV